MSDEAALLQAIIAHAGEDTPRLAYADWLEENEAPIQADFIRTQCRLAACSAADPDYPDLLERYAEIVAKFWLCATALAPPLPPGFAKPGGIERGGDDYRRGFLYSVCGEWAKNQMAPEDGEVEQFCAGLSRLVTTTTARKLDLGDMTPDQLAGVLASPGAEAMTGLSVSPAWFSVGDDGGDDLLRTLAGATSVAGLEELYLYMRATAAGLGALAGAKFGRLRHIDLPMLTGGRVRDLAPLTRAPWFQRLRSVRAGSSDRPLESALLAAFAKLPHLESLDLRFQHRDALKPLGSSRSFKSLARLSVWQHLGQAGAAILARGRFLRLAEFETHYLRSPQLLTLLKAPWFPQLRVLAISNSTLSDKAVVALSKSPVAARLRILRITQTPLGAGALAALGDGSRFPELTTLDLNTPYGPKPTPAETAEQLAKLNLPRLRHLNLGGYRLGDAGAKALAANASLANLTRLSLQICEIGDKGFAALVRSPHLQQLIELDASYNHLNRAAALLDPAVLPRLAFARLNGNRLTRAAAEKLRRARAILSI